MDVIPLSLVIVFCIACSAFFSSTETAFTTVNRLRMKSLAESGEKKAARVLHLTDDYDKLLSTILIGNNLVNIVATSLATVLFEKLTINVKAFFNVIDSIYLFFKNLFG